MHRSLTERLIELKLARNKIGYSIQNSQPLAPVLLSVIDELITQISERLGDIEDASR